MDTQERERFWREHVSAMARHSRGARGYAQEHGLKLSTLEWWKRKLRDAERARLGALAAANAFVPVKVADDGAVAQLGSRRSAVTIHLGEAVRLELAELPSVQWLAGLQHTIREQR